MILQSLYTIRRATTPPVFDGNWQAPSWQASETLEVALFHPRSGAHRPRTQARLLYDESAIYVFFNVDDAHVLSQVTTLNGPVCQDSCVEFFIQPRGAGAYFNFEVNAGGVLHCTWITDPTRGEKGFKDYHIISDAELGQVTIRGSLPPVVLPPLAGPLTWTMQWRIPRAFMETYTGPLGELAGQRWRGNFYKCGSHEHHWATWAPIGEVLNFHQPQFYAPIVFAR